MMIFMEFILFFLCKALQTNKVISQTSVAAILVRITEHHSAAPEALSATVNLQVILLSWSTCPGQPTPPTSLCLLLPLAFPFFLLTRLRYISF